MRHSRFRRHRAVPSPVVGLVVLVTLALAACGGAATMSPTGPSPTGSLAPAVTATPAPSATPAESAAFPLTLVDDEGTEVAIPARPERITLRLRQGPFRHLEGMWSFHALAEDACRVDFVLEYELRGGLMARLLAKVFGQIAQTMMDAFVREAERRGGA